MRWPTLFTHEGILMINNRWRRTLGTAAVAVSLAAGAGAISSFALANDVSGGTTGGQVSGGSA